MRSDQEVMAMQEAGSERLGGLQPDEDIDQGMSNQTDLVEIAAELQQVPCVKG